MKENAAHAHVTTGIGPSDYLDKMLAEQCAFLTFSPAGATVYQLGKFCTAAKKLHDCGLTRRADSGKVSIMTGQVFGLPGPGKEVSP